MLEDKETDYFCTVNDELAVATWDFEDIQRSILAGSEGYEKASIGVYVSTTFPSGAYAELSEDVMIVDSENFVNNVEMAYKRAEKYDEEDLEINQARRF